MLKSIDDMTRQEANELILRKLEAAVASFPNWRFHQILQNCGAEVAGEDHFFDESVETLESMNNNPTMKTAHEIYVKKAVDYEVDNK